MAQNVMITGTGRSYALGFNFVLRYLEAGDNVVATVRKTCPELEALKEQYGDKLTILTMDISSTESVEAAAKELAGQMEYLDLIVNNAVTCSPDVDKEFFDANLDYIAAAINVTAVGPMRVIKAFYPFLKKSPNTALIMNISSEAGSITKCYRTNMIDYGMAKAALNMAAMNLFNTFKEDPQINIFCVHPGWIRTNGKEDKSGPRFILNTGEAYPF